MKLTNKFVKAIEKLVDIFPNSDSASFERFISPHNNKTLYRTMAYFGYEWIRYGWQRYYPEWLEDALDGRNENKLITYEELGKLLFEESP